LHAQKGCEFAGSFDKNAGFFCRAINDRPYILRSNLWEYFKNQQNNGVLSILLGCLQYISGFPNNLVLHGQYGHSILFAIQENLLALKQHLLVAVPP